MKRTSILLADDHTMICAALQKLLEPEYEVIGCVGDGRALVKTALDLKLDLVLVDVGMPLLNGLDAGRELKKLMPRIKIIFLTMNPDPDVGERSTPDRSLGLSAQELAGGRTPAGGPQRGQGSFLRHAANQSRHGRELYPRPEITHSP